jgi:hypothetical protein
MAVKRKPRAPGGKKKEKSKADFASVFSQLRGVMKAYDSLYNVKTDQPKRYYLETKDARNKGNPMMFGAVILGKAYVSYHLVPLYVCPELKKTVPKELGKRMQGMACFNFKETDDLLFKQLGELTAASHEAFSKKK